MSVSFYFSECEEQIRFLDTFKTYGHFNEIHEIPLFVEKKKILFERKRDGNKFPKMLKTFA